MADQEYIYYVRRSGSKPERFRLVEKKGERRVYRRKDGSMRVAYVPGFHWYDTWEEATEPSRNAAMAQMSEAQRQLEDGMRQLQVVMRWRESESDGTEEPGDE